MSSRGGHDADEGRLLQLLYPLYLVGSLLARALPEKAAYAAANALGALQARLSRRKRAVVERNLARVTGDAVGSRRLQRCVVAAYQSYARYWLETFRYARATREFFLQRFVCYGAERLDAAVGGAKRPVVVVGHLGNWDAAGAWLAASGRPAVTVAEVVRPRRLFEFLQEHRARVGMTVYPAVTGVSARLVQAVNEGKLVAILGDRDLAGRGIEVSFFGARTTFPIGPAAIALRAGVPIVVAGVYGTELPGGRRGWEAHIGEPIELPDERGGRAMAELTQEVAAQVEGFVSHRPEEWHVFQPFWLDDRPPRS
ncbi:phosphatidylinositol mannoside acyltransferase [soil metagenome]